jgi:hypothetical protein
MTTTATTTSTKARTVQIQNAPLRQPVAIKVNDEWLFGEFKKVRGTSVYQVRTRKTTSEHSATTKVTYAAPEVADDAAYCEEHALYKMVRPGHSPVCPECNKTHQHRHNVQRKVDPAVRRAERILHDQAVREEAVRQQVQRLAEYRQRGIECEMRFMAASLAKYGEAAARSTYEDRIGKANADRVVAAYYAEQAAALTGEQV